MFLRDMILDSLDEDLTNDDIISRERAMDKEFIQLIQNACKSDNVPRAIELTKLLHNVKTLDAALKIADFYHLPGFKEKVERLKQIREEEEDRLVVAREKRRRWNKAEAPLRRLPDGDGSISRPRPFQDFGPPPSIPRPGLSRALPSVDIPQYQTTKHDKTWDDFDSMDTNEQPKNVTPEGKRKRTPEVEESQTDLMPPPKHSSQSSDSCPSLIDLIYFSQSPIHLPAKQRRRQKRPAILSRAGTIPARSFKRARVFSRRLTLPSPGRKQNVFPHLFVPCALLIL